MATPIQGDSRSTISIILGIRTSRRPKRSNYLINPLQHKAVNESESESRSAVSDSLRPHGLYSPWNSASYIVLYRHCDPLSRLHAVRLRIRKQSISAHTRAVCSESTAWLKRAGVHSRTLLLIDNAIPNIF